MGRSYRAILAVVPTFGVMALAAALAPAGDAWGAARWTVAPTPPEFPPVTVDPPLRIGFRLRDDVRIAGELTEWDREGFDGSFGGRKWIELAPDDAQRLFYRLMDRESAAHWIAFGRLLLLIDDGREEQAERAFERARRLDEEAGEAIEAARNEAEAVLMDRRKRADAKRSSDMRTTTPEAGDWKPTPWPEVSEDQQKSARLSIIADGEAVLDRVGVEIDPVESDFFIVFSEGDRRDTARLAVHLDRRYRALAERMGLESDQNIFWGKALVFLIADQDRFQLIEAGSFNQLTSLDEKSITHYSGPKVFINVLLRKDLIEAEAALTREMARGFLHRYRSPMRLPPWANEGIVEWLAQQVYDESAVHEGLRPLGLHLIRGGGVLPTMLEAEYRDESWRAQRREVAAVGSLIVEYLMKSGSRGFVTWVRTAKAGEEWRDALRRAYGVDAEALIASAVRFYRVND